MDSSEVGHYWEQNAETWTRLSRMGCDVYRDHLNTPAFLEMLPEVDGRTGLDIGCGEGYNTRKVTVLRARMIGIDIAPTFIKHAREVDTPEPLGIDYQVADGCSLPFALEAFDFVVAFMSLMDMPEHERSSPRLIEFCGTADSSSSLSHIPAQTHPTGAGWKTNRGGGWRPWPAVATSTRQREK